MDFELKELQPSDLAAQKCDALLVLVSASRKSDKSDLSTLIEQGLGSGDLETKPGKMLACYRPAGFQATRFILLGAGSGNARDVRKAVLAGVAALKGTAAKAVQLAFLAEPQAGALHAAVGAAADASYSYTTTLSKPQPRKIAKFTLLVPGLAAFKEEFARAQGIVQGVEFAKEWANRPGNHATPTLLAKAAQGLAKQRRMQCEILGPAQVAKLGMGSFQAVAKGSEEPLRFIVLRYQGAAKGDAPVVLVGKGITFDSGGVSLKPGAEMDEMKFDMSGAASVLGVFRSLGHLQPAINVVGLIPACENMPDGRAVKPGDVVTSMSGQTIEILNTDAEGRLVLCDALTYAERFKPAAVVDIATLTGACVIALGGVRSGLFANDDALAERLRVASEASQDLCWRMPLDEDYAEGLKTNFADVANIAGRAAGSVTAAKFLQRFAEKYPWAHLDIAGTAWKSGAAKGATGRPVGLLVTYLLTMAGEGKSAPPSAKRRAAK
jgi:leucyl aminopeptidase